MKFAINYCLHCGYLSMLSFSFYLVWVFFFTLKVFNRTKCSIVSFAKTLNIILLIVLGSISPWGSDLINKLSCNGKNLRVNLWTSAPTRAQVLIVQEFIGMFVTKTNLKLSFFNLGCTENTRVWAKSF